MTTAQISAAPMDVKLSGRTYRMSPLSDRALGEIDNYLKARIIRMARESLPPNASEEDRRMTMEAAITVASTITWTSAQGARMMGTIDGISVIMWQGLRPNHPELTPEEVRRMLLDPVSLDEATTAFDLLNASAGSKKKPVEEPSQPQ